MTVHVMIRNWGIRLLFVLMMIGISVCLTAEMISATSDISGKAKIKSEKGTHYFKSTSLKSIKIGKLAYKQSVTISKEKFISKRSRNAKYKWYYSSSVKGYIRSDKASFSVDKTKKGYLLRKSTVRRGAGRYFKKYKTYKKGKAVRVVLVAYAKDKSKWYKIRINGKYYYVKAKDVKIPKPATTAPAESNTEAAEEASKDGDALTSGENASSKTDLSEFPASYQAALKKLQASHSNWTFRAVYTNLDWAQAKKQMVSNTGANTIAKSSFPPSYFNVAKGCYNYLTNAYTAKDGANFISASPQAVYYYMDPRNWLTEAKIFMFEDQKYHSDYQTLEIVKQVLAKNSELKKNAQSFIDAGKKYNISPIYLASKAYNEQGTTVYSETISGKKYYNVFNIGATDSADGSAAHKGIVYASQGTSYGRPWTTVAKSILGGTQYLAANFSTNNQNSHYLEHFNVLNGLSSVGTHVYMTAVYAPSSNASLTYSKYKGYNILSKPFVFYIPVFNTMGDTASKAPSSYSTVDNNYYLKSLSLSNGISKTLISSTTASYTTTFNVSTTAGSCTINATVASKTGAKVSGSGSKSLAKGKNTFKVKVTASSGVTRTYTINITRS